jgi:hypothetical protein
MPKLEFGIGGGAYLSVPQPVARVFLVFIRLFGPRWFDTAFAYGEGVGEITLGPILRNRDNVITKWGLSKALGLDSTASGRWSSPALSPGTLKTALQAADKRLQCPNALYFLLHCADARYVQPHISELLALRDAGLVAGIGYSVNDSSEVLDDSSWADLIEAPLPTVQKLREFRGTIAIHGAFRSGVSDESLIELLSPIAASRVVLISGSWRPWRLLGNSMQVRRVGKSLKARSK